MQLYVGSSSQFIEDTVKNRIADKLKASFFDQLGSNPSPNEVRSWQNSLPRVCTLMQYAGLLDQGVILEYRIPSTSRRLDLMLTGVDGANRPHAVVVELKQWENVSRSEVDDCVVTFLGGMLRDALHPSRQVGNYQSYLENNLTAFTSGAVGIASCSFLHNLQYSSDNELFSPRHTALLSKYPLFAGDQTAELLKFIGDFVGGGDGHAVLAQVLESKYRASKKLLEHTSEVIKREPVYILLDEQQVAFNAVLAAVRRGFGEKTKAVILIKGGPGTGKSVIALNLVAELCGMGYNAQHATGSKAFTENVRRMVGSTAASQFRFFASYQGAEPNEIDVLILDEAHRMYATGNSRWTPKAQRSDRPLIEHIIEAAKVTVFFIDDLQVVRPDEVGRVALIRETALKLGVQLYEYELEAQFRCNGSDAFINWVDNTLGLRETANECWDEDDPFEFKIFDDVREMERVIREKQANDESARLVAGFCWKWSAPDAQGMLVEDVVIDGWSMPWNAKSDAGRLAAGVPRSHFWASDPNGINQVGCIYTAQNFEFDYVGVIFGGDLRYDPVAKTWVADKFNSFDSVVKRAGGDEYLGHVKRAYRVLLTRGLKGCFVYFSDPATREFFRSRICRS
ncbi:MAG TPA: DUF2075 domain-containing protein [Pyrinomonadaceae bacterium]|jgi:DUF2075 family protein|nr:DUF2075 domain-containing protein [Pyrinomonadaceae bacterium]